MVKITLKNNSRTITAILIKTVDKSSMYTANLYPTETIELFPWQYTGDIITKIKNGVLREIATAATPPIVTVSVERKAPKQVEESREDYKMTKRHKKEKF